MGKKIKFIIVALVGILAISIFINFQAYFLKKAIERERNELNEENIALERAVKEISQENQRLKERVDLLAKDMDRMAKEKEEAQKNYELANKTNDKLTEQLKYINARLIKEDDEKQKIQESLTSIKRKNTLLKRQLKSLIKRKALLGKGLPPQQKADMGLAPKKPVASTGAVELPPIVVYSQPETYLRQPQEAASLTPTATVAIEGKILGINKENNFVVIDLGLDSGVEIGDTFHVYRKDKAVASIEVIQTRKRISACDIKKEIRPIEVGDIVR